jgi:hypothetical protein
MAAMLIKKQATDPDYITIRHAGMVQHCRIAPEVWEFSEYQDEDAGSRKGEESAR